jgi:hypothetical protein
MSKENEIGNLGQEVVQGDLVPAGGFMENPHKYFEEMSAERARLAALPIPTMEQDIANLEAAAEWDSGECDPDAVLRLIAEVRRLGSLDVSPGVPNESGGRCYRLMADNLTLWDIESGLAEVLAAREEASTPEEQGACDIAIAAYIAGEVAKVDGIAGYARHCLMMGMAAKVEADRMAAKSKVWELRRKRMLGFVQSCMVAMGKRRLEGRVNTLLLKGDGGKPAVDVQGWDKEHGRWTEADPGLLPDEMCWAEIKMPFDLWRDIAAGGSAAIRPGDKRLRLVVETRTPRLTVIANALVEPCQMRSGSGHSGDGESFQYPCGTCGVSGFAGVPGASLKERGEHVEIK